MALLSFNTLQKPSISEMNLAGGADLMIVMLFLVNSERVSIVLSLLLQSLVPKSESICLNSSITMGSIGFDTKLFVFLNVFEVVLNP